MRSLTLEAAVALAFAAALPAQVSKTLDLTTATLDLTTATATKTHYVVFASRGRSATGHSFVIWGVEDGGQKRSTIQALGLYPEKDAPSCSSLTGKVPGLLLDELATHSVEAVDQELIVRVDEADFARALRVARQWNCRHEFSLLSHDCVEFLRAVGESLQLPMPKRNVTRWTPQAYVRALLASVREGTLDLGDTVYEGFLMDDQPMGKGSLRGQDGGEIDGSFRGLDHHSGAGEFPVCRGSFEYEGGVVDFRAQGKGVLRGPNGLSIRGVFEQGKLMRKQPRPLADCGPIAARWIAIPAIGQNARPAPD